LSEGERVACTCKQKVWACSKHSSFSHSVTQSACMIIILKCEIGHILMTLNFVVHSKKLTIQTLILTLGKIISYTK
jgi:hypothetical protein